MNNYTITFDANEQTLVCNNPYTAASNTVQYILAHFNLGENWDGFDSVRAIWYNDEETIATVLDSDGNCFVPMEVLNSVGNVTVNLVGSIIEDEVAIDRLTTFPIKAIKVSKEARIEGSETADITPSQFEQFAAAVSSDADRAVTARDSAQGYANSASGSASDASGYADAASGYADDASGYASDASDYATDASGYATDAETYKNQAVTSAQNAEISAQNADNSADEAEAAKDAILGMSAEATTLPAGSDATASYSDGTLSLGIPRGDKGDKGDKGNTGDTGSPAGFGTVSATIDGGVGTPSVDVTSSGADTAKNFAFAFHNLKGDKGDTGEVSYEEISALLPTDTATGDIASFPDGQSVIPAKSVSVSLEPIQDLHGYDKPWSGGAGKNKLQVTATTQSKNGITMTVNEDGTLTVNGTCTYTSWFELADIVLDGNYILNGCPSGGGSETYGLACTTAGSTAYDYGSGANATFDGTSKKVYMVVSKDATTSNLVFKPMIRLASETDATFAPYSNICPISGRTECVTYVSGKDYASDAENGVIDTDGTDVASSGKRTPYVAVSSGNIIKASIKNNAGGYRYTRIVYYDADKQFVSMPYNSVTAGGATKELEETVPSGVAYVRLATSDGVINTFKVISATYTTELGRTVYGGTLDVASGVLTVDRALVTVNSLTVYSALSHGTYTSIKRFTLSPASTTASASQKNGATASMGVQGPAYFGANRSNESGSLEIDFAINTNGDILAIYDDDTAITDADFMTKYGTMQICYPLATPQTYQLTPTEVDLLLGQNNVWSDGTATVTYNADIQRWVEKRLGA